MFKENFKNLYNHEIKGTILKSLIYSLLVSLSVLFVISLAFWIADVEKYWLAIIVFAVLEVIMFSIFFLVFKPTDKTISKKLDSLGLKQRVITMYEYQDKDTLMARIQRQNAVDHINKVNVKMLKIALPVIVVVFTCIAFALSVTTTTFAALSSHDIIDNGKNVIEDIIPQEIFSFELIYDVDGEGMIDGDMFQVVYEGEDGTAVNAVADEGWAFAGWDDGYEDPYRVDLNIHENLSFIATFMELDEQQQDGEGEGEGEPQDGEQSDEPQDLESTDDADQYSEDPSDQEGGGMGGKYEPNNQVVDGETYYGGSTFDSAYGDAMGDMQGNNGLSDGEKSVVGDYFSNIEK